jgi:hypothetical protein
VTINAGNALLTLSGYTGISMNTQSIARMSIAQTGNVSITNSNLTIDNGTLTVGYTDTAGGNRNGQINVNSVYSSAATTGTLAYNPSGTLWQMSGNLGLSGGGIKPTYSNTNLVLNTLTSGSTTSSNIIFQTNNTERMRINVSTGDLQIKNSVFADGNISAANINATSGFSVGASAGITGNFNMTNGAGNTCWMNFTGGILTASDC